MGSCNRKRCIILFAIFAVSGFLLVVPRHTRAALETIRYRYDDARQITGVTYDDGTFVEYAYDGSGNRLFKTVTAETPLNNPPSEASTPSVPDGAEGVPTLPVLSWTGGDPDEGDGVIYFVSFGECGSETLAYSGTRTRYSPGRLKSYVNYCWRVTARDNHNAETPGPLWRFTTGNAPPDPVVLMAPLDGSILYTSSTILKWTGSDPNPDDSVTYDIYFGTTASPPLIESGYAGTDYPVGGLVSGMTYYLRIAARDDHQTVTEGTVLSFTRGQLVPGMTISGYHENNSYEDVYTVTFSGGDTIKVRAGFLAYGPDPQIRIYRADGSLLCENRRVNYKWHRHAAEIDACLIQADGTYTLTVSDYGADETGGAYSLSVQRLINGSVDLSFGQAISGELTGTAGVNIHTFSAEESDAVMIRMGFDAGGGDPQLRIYDPGGAGLNSASCSGYMLNGDATQYPAEIINCVLPRAGVYTVVVSEMDGDEEGGGYQLLIEKLNNELESLSYGRTVADVLASTVDFRSHTFTAASGDVVMARLGFTTNGINPVIRIFSPDGSRVACQALMPNYLYADGRYAAEIQECILSDDGIHTIIVSTYAGEGPGGEYYLKIGRVNSSAATMSYGQTVSSELAVSPDFQVHAFTAEVNDRIIVRMGFADSGPDPQISLYGPSGNWMSCGSASYRLNNGNSAETAICLLPEEGIYTVVASEFYGDESGGSYKLTIERLNNSLVTMDYGGIVQYILESKVDMDVHAFAGYAGDNVLVRMGFTGPGPDPQIRIFDPLGRAMPCQAFRTNSTSSLAAEITSCALPVDGTYTVLVSEYEGNETGEVYNLAVERLNNTSQDISYGQSVSGTLSAPADTDARTFIARENDLVGVTMGFTSPGPDPQMRLFGSSGDTVLCQNYKNNTSSNDPAVIAGCLIPSDGSYTIIISEYNGNETGGVYDLSLECQSGLCNIPPIAAAGGPYSGVEGQEVSFDGSGSSDPDGAITLYEWDVDNDGFFEYSSPLPMQGHAYEQQGTYTMKLRVTDNTGAASESMGEVFIADSVPAADFTVEPSAGTAPLSVSFVNSSAGYDQPLFCEWDFDNDGTVDSFEYDPVYSYNNTGIYTIILKVTDSDGSSDTIIQTDCVTVIPADCQSLPVRTEGAEPLSFSTIQSAYDSARDGEVLLIRSASFSKNLVFDREMTVTLKGGYDCSYSSIDGTAAIDGTLVINDGTVIISDGTIQVQ